MRPDPRSIAVRQRLRELWAAQPHLVDNSIPNGKPAERPAVGRLVHRVTTKHTETQIDDGDFYLRFHIHLTRP